MSNSNKNLTSEEKLIRECLRKYFLAKKTCTEEAVDNEVDLRISMLKREYPFNLVHRDIVIREIAIAMKSPVCGFQSGFTHHAIAFLINRSDQYVAQIAGNINVQDYATINKQ